MKRKEVLTENPLAIALMGALVGMGLEKEKAKKAAAQAVNDAQTGAWKDPDKQPAAAKPAPQGDDYNKILKRGSRGEGVKQLQRNLGMTGSEVDGIFGPATEKAVRTFQKYSGAKVDANEELGLDDFSEFLEDEATMAKIENLMDVRDAHDGTPDWSARAKSLAIFSAFTEGVNLFSSFAVRTRCYICSSI